MRSTHAVIPAYDLIPSAGCGRAFSTPGGWGPQAPARSRAFHPLALLPVVQHACEHQLIILPLPLPLTCVPRLRSCQVFEDLEASRYQHAELRISIYGRKKVEWDILASWVVCNNLYSDNVEWLIQVRRGPASLTLGGIMIIRRFT